MSSLTDHVRRDAEHAARSAIRVQLSRFTRRMDAQAKAHIADAIAAATAEGEAVDGLTLGREAADLAVAVYIGPGEPQPAIEASANS